MTIPDLLRTLPRASWRGVEYPWTSREVTYSHSIVRHRVQYGLERVEPQGPENARVTFEVPARRGLRNSGEDAYDTVLPRLWEAMRDRSHGELIDPVWGSIQCVPEQWSDKLEAQMRDGASVTLAFLTAPESDITADTLTTRLPAELSQTILATWPEAPGLPRPPSNLLRSITAILALAQAGQAFLLGPLLGLISDLRQLENQLSASLSPDAWAVVQLLRELRLAAQRLANRGPAARPARRVTTRAQASPARLAKLYNTPVADLLRLNPDLATVSTVRAGTAIFVNG